MTNPISTPYSETEAREIIESILPDPQIRQIGLSMFAEIIVEANYHKRDFWAITNTNNYPYTISLQVGNYISFMLSNNQTWLAR